MFDHAAFKAAAANQSGLTVVQDPSGAWSYYKLSGVQGSSTFYPTDTSEFESAVFQNYVIPDQSPSNSHRTWFAETE